VSPPAASASRAQNNSLFSKTSVFPIMQAVAAGIPSRSRAGGSLPGSNKGWLTRRPKFFCKSHGC